MAGRLVPSVLHDESLTRGWNSRTATRPALTNRCMYMVESGLEQALRARAANRRMRYRVRIPSRQTGAAGWRHPVRLLSCALALLMATPLLLDACGTSGKPPSGSQNALARRRLLRDHGR